MNQGNVQASKLTVAGSYFFLFFLFVWPLVDLASTGWPVRLGSLEWRYGFFGLLTSYLHTPILAVLLAMVLAFFLGHGRTFRILSILCLVMATFILVVLGLFPLDAIQLRSAQPPERLNAFQMGALFAELKHLTAFVTVSLLGVGGWRTAGRMVKQSRSREGSGLTAEVIKAQKRD